MPARKPVAEKSKGGRPVRQHLAVPLPVIALDPENDFATKKDVMGWFDASPEVVDRAVTDGTLRLHAVGPYKFFLRSELRAYVAGVHKANAAALGA